ncbi:predicted protein [Uncinocarpus reesii 1704]|uniref:Uncharacterized protein n=1 Tax=Uncinocarpus reesii (strain UAMH 1704) TaxID=336963 RepID=C4JYB5_UNCRE|nr:uncharacterized protein UREG_07166 [Uncinocarpus reesii 1704]EEP82301.1 predicted protein [Uncinocarpus reesii 1704]
MEANSSASHNRGRLEELAAGLGVFMNRHLPRLRRESVSSFSQEDKAAAESLARQKRLEAFSSKSHVFRRTPSQRNFKKNELYAAIETAIQENRPIGVVECLLSQVKDAKAKKPIFKHQQETGDAQIEALLLLAAEKQQAGVLSLLASHADPASIAMCLRYSVAASDLDSVKALLQNGADPNFCHTAILESVGNGNTPLVKLFLSSEIPLAKSCLDKALPIAVSNGSLQLVIALLQQGADANSGELFESVVKAGRIDLIAALASAEYPPSRQSLNRALGNILLETTTVTEERRLIIEILVCAGASGENVTKALTRAVFTNDQKLASTIVTHHDLTSYNPFDAIIKAIEMDNVELLTTLFNGNLDGECASAILAKFPKISGNLPCARKLWITSTLVRRGAGGVALDEYLVDSVEQNDELLVKFLVDHGASVDYLNAKALCFAMSPKSFQIFKKLLDGKPSRSSFAYCFCFLPTLSMDLQLKFASELLRAGARGEAVDMALIGAVSAEDTMERNQYIDILVKHGASVDAQNGCCFQEATKSGDIVALSLLLKGEPSAISLARAISQACELPDKELRFTIVDLLLTAGARGPLIDAQLIELVQESPVDIVLVGLFLEKGKADVNTNGGEAIQLACKSSEPKLLKVLLQFQPSSKALNGAFLTAISLQDSGIRYKMCHRLLDAGISGEMLSTGLIAEQSSPSSNLKLMELLLNHGANVNFNNGATIRRAVKQSNELQLALLASRTPSRQTILGGLELLLQPTSSKRYELATVLLNAMDESLAEPLSIILLEAVRSDIRDIRFLKLLLQHGASADYQQGLAMRKSIDYDYFEAFEVFLGHSLSPGTLETVFESSLLLKGTSRVTYITRVLEKGCSGRCIDEALLKVVQEKPCDKEVVLLLLKYGASVHFANSQPLVHAALSHDALTLELLLESASEETAATYVLGKTVSAGVGWLSADGLPIIKSLLHHGASGEVLHLALIAAIENAMTNPEVAHFVDLLLQFGASGDYHDGRALRAAISKGQLLLVRKIIESNPSGETLMIGLSCVLTSDLSEDMSLQLVEILNQDRMDIQSIETAWSNTSQRESLLFLCLKKWPRGTRVLEKLLQNGMNVNQTTPYLIESECGLEHVSVLLWALLQPQQKISSYVIECLLKHGADPDFQSTGSLMSPILIAAMERPAEIVLKLIQHGADASRCDKDGRSSLLYATRKNQIKSMRFLIEGGAAVDDGSLHEAARALNLDAIQLLLSYGHDPNFPSMLHDGRCAMANLCLCASDVGLPVSRIRKAIDTLVSGKADLRDQSQGKPVLLHALDNPKSCVRITTALLASGMWKIINDESNLYTADKSVYSPSMYIKKCLQKSPREHAPQLLYILQAHGCKDVYYRLSGPQPPDMVNAPPEIAAEENRRQIRAKRLQEEEEDHQIRLKQNDDIAKQQNVLMTRTHNLRIQHDRQIADEREATTERSAKHQLRLEAESAA